MADVAQGDIGAVSVDEYRLRNLLRRNRLALGLEDDALIRSIDKTGAANSRRLPGDRDNLIDGQAVVNQPLGAELELDLPGLLAEDRDFRNSWYDQESWPEGPVSYSG